MPKQRPKLTEKEEEIIKLLNPASSLLKNSLYI